MLSPANAGREDIWLFRDRLAQAGVGKQVFENMLRWRAHGLKPAQMALAWGYSRWFKR